MSIKDTFISCIDSIRVINLSCKQDTFSKNNPFFDGKYESVDVADSSTLETTPYIKHLFRENDFNWDKKEIVRALAHYKIWQKISLGECGNNVLILEDNIVLDRNFIESWNKIANDMSGAGLVYLGGVSSEKKHLLDSLTEQVNGSFARVKEQVVDGSSMKARRFDFTAYSYILTKTAAQKICAVIDKIGFFLNVDDFLKNLYGLITIHFSTPLLCTKKNPSIFDYKAVYICPDHNEKYHTRKLHMDKLLSDLGFTDIVHFKSGNEKYPICLSIATIDVLKKYMDVPFILFEDDIECTGNMELDSVANADAVYLGLSEYASHPTENRNVYPSQIVPYSNSQVRIENMLAAHAILYISKAYKQAVIDILETNKFKCVNDIAISRIQKDYLVLANMKPMFFQSKKFNPPCDNGFCVEKATNIIIDSEMKFIRNNHTSINTKSEFSILDALFKNNAQIQKNIFISWKNKNILDLPFNIIQNGIKNLKDLNPDYRFEINDDADIDKYLFENISFDDYQLIKHKHIVEKTDLWRLLKIYNEGGIYMDLDRLCNIPLNKIIIGDIKCILPMHNDIDFSQDIIISCSNNIIHERAIELNLERRRNGCTDVLSLGPITYFHACTEVLLGKQIDRFPKAEDLAKLREVIKKCKYLGTYRESPPYDTIVYKGGNINFDKDAFYKSQTVSHWVQSCGNYSNNKPFGK